MARFVFKLEALLEQRRREEQQCQRALAERAAAVNAAEEAIRIANESIVTGQDDVRRHLMGSLDMGFLTAHRRFMVAIQRQIAELMTKLAAARNNLEQARVQLAEAAKRRKAIEKLRERQFDRWRADQARREAALADEIGSQLAFGNLREDQTRTHDQLTEVME
jgi:flagellar FliJ protein